MIKKLATAIAVALTFTTSLVAADDAAGDAARKIFADYQDSVLWVSGVSHVSVTTDNSEAQASLPDQDRKFETLATVIASSGLLVTSLDGIDVSQQITGREVKVGSAKVTLDATATIKEMRVTMPDGTELPAEIVMKDVDLNLAFIRIKAGDEKAKGQTFKAVDLKNTAKAVIAERVVSLNRADDVLNRQPSVMTGQVVVLVKKPREFVRVSSAYPGTPTFNLDGKVLGVAVNRFGPNKATATTGVTVLIPAADVLEIATQALNAKPPVAADSGKSAEK